MSAASFSPPGRVSGGTLTDRIPRKNDVVTANDIPDDLVALAGFPSNPNRYLRLGEKSEEKSHAKGGHGAENSPPESPSTRGTEDYQKKFKTLRERLLALREKAKQTRLARLGEVIAKQVRKNPRKIYLYAFSWYNDQGLSCFL